jgi:hypothetical protein
MNPKPGGALLPGFDSAARTAAVGIPKGGQDLDHFCWHLTRSSLRLLERMTIEHLMPVRGCGGVRQELQISGTFAV